MRAARCCTARGTTSCGARRNSGHGEEGLLILLVRHGKPVCDDRTPVAGSSFATWVRDYDAASIDAGVPPPATLKARAEAVGCIATSNLQRARESAQLVAPNRPILSDALFAEAEIPAAISMRLTLAPRYWSVLARAAWFCGWSRGVESLRQARIRAQRAAERLAALAAEHGSVMLVGHGMMNWLISRALRRGDWRGTASGFAFWSVTALQRVA